MGEKVQHPQRCPECDGTIAIRHDWNGEPHCAACDWTGWPADEPAYMGNET